MRVYDLMLFVRDAISLYTTVFHETDNLKKMIVFVIIWFVLSYYGKTLCITRLEIFSIILSLNSFDH